MENNLVSIITPTFNCGSFISETIKSVLNQTYKDWELIIIDDQSTDNTKEVVESFSDPRIKYYLLDKNSGAAIARNKALELAKGRWIAFLDSDDLWKPYKLEKQINFMTKNDYAFSYHKYHEIDEEGNPLGITVKGKKKVGKFGMFSCCWPGCLTVMYDRDKVGLIQIEDIKKNNDSAMWLKVIRKADCYFFDEDLAAYRRRQNSITPADIFTKIKWHYILFKEAEKMNPVFSFFWMMTNIVGNSYKKIFYVSKST